MSRSVPYELGWHEVADGVFAYLQPDGSWGYSNAGLVLGDGEALLVDTLFDLVLTEAMLEAARPLLGGREITTVVNTHANGDHCFGNEAVRTARIIASSAAAEEMADLPASALAVLSRLDFGPVGNEFVAEAFGAFHFEGIEAVGPTEQFTGSLRIALAGRQVTAYELGPAHTAGDVVVEVADAQVVFAGDLAFIGSTPLIWAGPVANWLAALDRIRAMAPGVVVPGHGPVVSLEGLDPIGEYLAFVLSESATRHAVGMSALEAAFDLDLGLYARWLDSERIILNVEACYAELDPAHERANLLSLFGELGRYRRERSAT